MYEDYGRTQKGDNLLYYLLEGRTDNPEFEKAIRFVMSKGYDRETAVEILYTQLVKY